MHLLFCTIRHERVGADQGKIHITKPNDGSGGDAFTIDHLGNVGINETSPNHKLVVQGNIQIGDWQTSGSRYIGYARADNSNFGTAGASGLEIESAAIGVTSVNICTSGLTPTMVVVAEE